jgi:hypothetical protein
MTWETYRATALRQLPRGANVEERRSGIAVTVPCQEGHEERIDFGKLLPADAILKAIKQRGWRIKGNKAICPKHGAINRKDENVSM